MTGLDLVAEQLRIASGEALSRVQDSGQVRFGGCRRSSRARTARSRRGSSASFPQRGRRRSRSSGPGPGSRGTSAPRRRRPRP
ncbi:MAG: hypothetical protein ACJ74P_00050 [Gaiellaceae bacterium]